jgi:hypothetical protein
MSRDGKPLLALGAELQISLEPDGSKLRARQMHVRADDGFEWVGDALGQARPKRHSLLAVSSKIGGTRPLPPGASAFYFFARSGSDFVLVSF